MTFQASFYGPSSYGKIKPFFVYSISSELLERREGLNIATFKKPFLWSWLDREAQVAFFEKLVFKFRFADTAMCTKSILRFFGTL